uniref:Uncharacterized protein n=1 Tax=Lepeophtheirus salmonis TaxID=72036 RepID=A0A0K2TFP0_LEPSM
MVSKIKAICKQVGAREATNSNSKIDIIENINKEDISAPGKKFKLYFDLALRT